MTAVFACNAFTDYSLGQDARDYSFSAALPVVSISLTVTAWEMWISVASQEPWGPVAHHAHLMSIHSHWGSQTCFARGSSLGSVAVL